MTIAYTEAQTKELIEKYLQNSTIDELAVAFNKTRKSIVAKLSKEGVYEKKGYLTKRGIKPEAKSRMSTDIESVLGVRLYQLDKVPKPTLQLLRDKIVELHEKNIQISTENDNLLESKRILGEMLDAKTV